MFCWEAHPSIEGGRASSVRGSSCFDSDLSLSVDSSIKSVRRGVETERFPCIIGNVHRDSMCISGEWNITIGRRLLWLIDSSVCIVFVFVGGDGTSLTKTNDETGELASNCSHNLTECWSACACLYLCVCVRERALLKCAWTSTSMCMPRVSPSVLYWISRKNPTEGHGSRQMWSHAKHDWWA